MITDPALVAARYRIDALDLPGAGRTDELGREWLLTAEKGWSTAPAPRTNREAKPDYDGSYRSTARRNEKSINVRGSVSVPDAVLIEQTLVELAALFGDGDRLYQLRRTAGAWDLTRDVELDAEPEVEVVGHYDVDFEFTFAAPDPRKHDVIWQEPRSTSIGTNTGGLDYGANGLNYASPGLNYGLPSDPIPAQVTNAGTATARPFFELRGLTNGLATPTVVCAETSDVVDYRADLAPNEVVYVNCDEHPARGVAAQSAVSTIRGDVSGLLTVGLAWPAVAAGATGTYQLLTAGTSEALTVALRSAYR